MHEPELALRLLQAHDAPALATFLCSRPVEPWTAEVETFVQCDGAGWLFDPGLPDDGCTGIAVETVGHRKELVGVAFVDHDVPMTQPDGTRVNAHRVYVIAVQSGWQRRGVGRLLLEAVLQTLDDRDPFTDSLIVAVIDERNLASITLFSGFGFAVEPDPSRPGHVIASAII